jgi:UDP-glucose 4-epimerase
MARYLITGGAGFIGSHLAEYLLLLDHEVVILDNLSYGKKENIPPKCKFIHGDILDSSLLKTATSNVEGIFHLAAIASVQKSVHDWLGTNQVNLVGTIKIFEEASKKNIPVVYASSAAIYGNLKQSPLTEDLLPKPLSGYAVDKYACELQAVAFGAIHNLATFGLRFFNVYGLRQKPDSTYSGVISIFINNIKKGKELDIYGDGNQQRDFIYVKDVVKFIYSAIDKTSHQAPVANVCTGKGTSINQIAQQIIKLMKPTKINHKLPRKGETYICIGSPKLAKLTLGIEAKTPLEAGLYELCVT